MFYLLWNDYNEVNELDTRLTDAGVLGVYGTIKYFFNHEDLFNNLLTQSTYQKDLFVFPNNLSKKYFIKKLQNHLNTDFLSWPNFLSIEELAKKLTFFEDEPINLAKSKIKIAVKTLEILS